MIRKFVAGFLSVIFILVSVEFAVFAAVLDTLLDRDFYGEEFVEIVHEGVISQMPELLNNVEQFPKDIVSEEEVMAMVERIFTKEDLATAVNDTIDTLAQLEVREDQTVEVGISLAWIADKREVVAEEITSLIKENVELCSGNQRLEDVENFECLPQELADEDLQVEVARILDTEVFANIPDRLATDIGNIPKGIEGNLSEFFFSALNLLYFVIGMVLFIVLAVMGLLIFSPAVRVIKWEAKTIFIAAFLLTLISLFMLYTPSFFTVFGGQISERLSVEQRELFLRFYELVFSGVSSTLLRYSLPVMVISLGVWIVGIVHDKKNKDGIEHSK